MAVLWLRFLTEINSNTKEAPMELLENPDTNKALEEVEITAFTEDELRAYDKFWDTVRTEKTLQQDSFHEGFEQGIKQGIEKGIEQGIEQGIEKQKQESAKRMLAKGLTVDDVALFTGLSKEQITNL